MKVHCFITVISMIKDSQIGHFQYCNFSDVDTYNKALYHALLNPPQQNISNKPENIGIFIQHVKLKMVY